MKVLVCAASRHGATAQIADRIGTVLRRSLAAGGRAPDVTVRTAGDAGTLGDLSGFDAFVLGSAVYRGHWLDAARDLVSRQSSALRGHPVWLFSSGPVGDPLMPSGLTAVDVTGIIAETGALEHRLFAGKLDRHGLGAGERALAVSLHAPDGDYRDWAAVDDWARSIAADLC